MPRTRVVFYREADGEIPLLEWLDQLPARAKAKCELRLERLREMGHELRRPEADYLRDGIYELRVALGTVNYRMLYFFHGTIAAVVSHGLTKEGPSHRVKSTSPSGTGSPLPPTRLSTHTRSDTHAQKTKTNQ